MVTPKQPPSDPKMWAPLKYWQIKNTARKGQLARVTEGSDWSLVWPWVGSVSFLLTHRARIKMLQNQLCLLYTEAKEITLPSRILITVWKS